ncbi:hypothetical protein KO492_05220 [Celeribacter halophilus]|nr:hypothetical protein [Celeribacter halophilus]MBU2889090.1 hypothetical protein [Celeribacter halophilus]
MKWVAHAEQPGDAIRFKQFIRNHAGDTAAHGLPAYDQWAVDMERIDCGQVL